MEKHYWDKGWTHYGSIFKDSDGGHVSKTYDKFKKKVKVIKKKKVKVGYKKVKKPIYITVTNVIWNNDIYDYVASKKLYVLGAWTEEGPI